MCTFEVRVIVFASWRMADRKSNRSWWSMLLRCLLINLRKRSRPIRRTTTSTAPRQTRSANRRPGWPPRRASALSLSSSMAKVPRRLPPFAGARRLRGGPRGSALPRRRLAVRLTPVPRVRRPIWAGRRMSTRLGDSPGAQSLHNAKDGGHPNAGVTARCAVRSNAMASFGPQGFSPSLGAGSQDSVIRCWARSPPEDATSLT